MTVADLLVHIQTLSRLDKLQLMQLLATDLLREATPSAAEAPPQPLQQARRLRAKLDSNHFAAADIEAAIHGEGLLLQTADGF